LDFIRRTLGSRAPAPDAGDEAAPGWDAIDRHLEAHYGPDEPQHWGTIIRYRLGGPDPLDGVSAYDHAGPPGHWHYVSYGLSELYAKESEDAARSGWGIELTFRLAHGPDETAPIWPVNFLQNLARYVVDSGNVLWPGHHMNANGPIAVDIATALEAAAFVEDPELGAINTPHGSVRFVQVVGITPGEYEALRRWNTDSMVALLRRGNPLLVSDLSRASILDDPATAAEVDAGQARDGSSMAGVYLDSLSWREEADSLHVTIGAAALEDWAIMLKGRLALGREASLFGPEQKLDLVPGNTFGWHRHEEGGIALTLPPAVASQLATLDGRTGGQEWPEAPGLAVHVEPGT
jgi:suppressor of fused